MTPEQLAALQARAYRDQSPWSATDFRDLLARPTTRVWNGPGAFLLVQIVADEAEVLALATDPRQQRQGQARQLMTRFHAAARDEGVTHAFLEVAAPNAAARGLYASLGYAQAGLRRGYYARPDGPPVDAIVMTRAL